MEKLTEEILNRDIKGAQEWEFYVFWVVTSSKPNWVGDLVYRKKGF